MDTKLKKFSSLIRKKKELMGCIFLTLIIQLVISVIIMKYDQDKNIIGNLMKTNKWTIKLSLFVGMIFILFVIRYVKSFALKQLSFGLFSILMGLLLSSTVHIINDYEIVEGAAYATLINFALMFVLGLVIVYFGYDISWLVILLFIGLLILITIEIIALFSPQSEEYYKKIAYVSVVVFSLYILYDTNKILLKYENKSNSDCINGAMEYYLDIINLFEDYLRIGSRK